MSPSLCFFRASARVKAAAGQEDAEESNQQDDAGLHFVEEHAAQHLFGQGDNVG
jgi:hypothetical protein